LEPTQNNRQQPNNTSILARKSMRGDWFIREATEIDLNPKNMNLKDGFSLSGYSSLLFILRKKECSMHSPRM
jgi:hypothetical protein